MPTAHRHPVAVRARPARTASRLRGHLAARDPARAASRAGVAARRGHRRAGPADVDPTAVVVASRRAGEPWFVLEQPDRERSALATLGCVAALEAHGPGPLRARSRAAGARWPPRRCCDAPDDRGRPRGSGPVAVGGFAFAPDGRRGPALERLRARLPARPRGRDRAPRTRTCGMTLARARAARRRHGRRPARGARGTRRGAAARAAAAAGPRPGGPGPGGQRDAARALRGRRRARRRAHPRRASCRRSCSPARSQVHADRGAARRRRRCSACSARRSPPATSSPSAAATRRSSPPRPSCSCAATACAPGRSRWRARRGARADPAVDDHLGEQLLRSEKDRGEQAIVTRRIERALRARRAVGDGAPRSRRSCKMANIQHLATPIRAQLAERVPAVELAGLLHPTPAVGGEPWADARPLIPALEGLDRGWYAGPVGWTDLNEDGEFCVALRCALLDGPRRALLRGRRRGARLRPGGRAGRDGDQAPGAAAGPRALGRRLRARPRRPRRPSPLR